MKLSLALTLVAGATSAAAFAPVSTRWGASRTALSEATLEYDAILEAGSGVDAAEFKAKLAANKEKMAEKDKTSKSLSKEVSRYAGWGFPSSMFFETGEGGFEFF